MNIQNHLIKQDHEVQKYNHTFQLYIAQRLMCHYEYEKYNHIFLFNITYRLFCHFDFF